MELLTTLLLLGAFGVGQLITTRQYRQLDQKINRFASRQSDIRWKRRESRIPSVDAQARTTSRDSDDLPATGRMSTGVHRKKRTHARAEDDH